MMILRLVLILAVVVLVAGLGYIRFAPSNPAQWHTDPGPGDLGPCDRITTTTNAARVACLHADTPQEVLARLDAIALQTPRTTRLAGSPEAGRVTWVTRSALMGFPDYTTAQAEVVDGGTRLDMLARSRFGESDLGVNSRRLLGWISAL